MLESGMARKKEMATLEDESLIRRLLVEFEQARHVDEMGREYWFAREYMEILGYTNWRNFHTLVDRAKVSLEQEAGVIADHFDPSIKMIEAGKGAKRETPDYTLTRHACYLISINGDPAQKPAIAAAQRYFIVQARKQEISEMLHAVGADSDRLAARQKLADTEKVLTELAAPRVTRPDVHLKQIRDAGHAALMGKSSSQIREHLGVPEGRDVMDFADPLLVKGSDFATAITNRQLRDDEKLSGVRKISETHAENHADARGMLTKRRLMPGELPPAEDIRKVQGRLDKRRAKLASKQAELP
jgi:DNA-damage-inducible protein D